MDDFEMEEINQPDSLEGNEQQPKRTTLLLILCILTFIGSGYSFLYYLLLPMVKSQLPEIMEMYGNLFSKMDGNMVDAMNDLLEFMASVPTWKYLLVALGFAGSVTGAAFMLKLRKEGLHIYIISQILVFAFLSFVIGGPMQPSIVDIMWTITFILLYYLQLKQSNVKF